MVNHLDPETDRKIRRLIAGEVSFEEGKKDKPTALMKLSANPIFDLFIIAMIILNLCLLATDNPEILWGDQSSRRLNLFLLCDIVFVVEMFVRMGAMKPAVYFRDAWFQFDFANSLVAIIVITLRIVAAIYTYWGLGDLRRQEMKIWPVVHSFRVIKFLRLLKPYGLSPPFPSVIKTIDSIAETFPDIILLVVMIFIVMVVAAIVGHILFGDSLQYRCVPFMDSNGEYSVHALNDSMFELYGASYFTSSYNNRYCGHKASATECDIGFNCTNIGISFSGGTADYSDPGGAFLANLTFITMRGWGDLFFALVDANGPALCFALLAACFIIVSQIYVNMISAVFTNNMRKVETREMKSLIESAYPGTKETSSELEILIWAFNSGVFLETELGEDRILTKTFSYVSKAIEVLRAQRKEDKMVLNGAKPKGNEGKNKNRAKKEELGEPYCVPKCRGCDAVRWFFASESGPLSLFVIFIVLVDTVSLAFDSSNPSDQTLQALAVIDLVATSIFIVDVVLRIAVMGPCMFFDNSFNILDFTLVLFNVISFVTGTAGFISNFRVVRLFRLMRLYKIMYLMKLREGQASSDASIGLVRFVSLLMEIGRPVTQFLVLLMTVMFTMAIIGMHSFGIVDNYTSLYDAEFPGLTPLVLVWSGVHTLRMNFESFAAAFITLFNMSCLDGWYPTMWTYIKAVGFESAVFFVFWIIVSNWLMQGLLTAFVMLEMEKLARDYILCESIGNKITIQNIIRIKDNQRLTLTFGVMKKFASDIDGELLGETTQTTKLVKEAAEDEPELPWLTAFFLKRKNYRMYFVKPGGVLEIIFNSIKNSLIFNLAVSFSVLISVATILNSADGGGDGYFYFDTKIWTLINLIVTAIFLAEMFLMWAVYGMFSPKATAYFWQPINWLEFIVNAMMIIGMVSTDDNLKSLLRKFRIVRIAKLPGIITSFSTNRSLNTFLQSITASFTSITSVVMTSIMLIFFIAIIGVQVFKGLFNHCSYSDYPNGRSFSESDSAYPNGCEGIAFVNFTADYSATTDLYVTTRVDNFDNIGLAMNSVFRVFMLNDWQGILYSALDFTSIDHQPYPFANLASFLFFIPSLLLGLVMLSLLIGVIYYHYIVENTFTGYKVVRDYSWTQWFMNEPKIKQFKKVIFGSREALWVVYEELLPHITQLFDVKEPDIGDPRYYLYHLQRNNIYKLAVSGFMAFPLVLITCYYKATYATTDWIIYDTYFNIVYCAEFAFRVYVDGLSKTKSTLGIVDTCFSGVLIFLCVFSYSRMDAFTDLDFHLVKLSVILRIFRLITAYETTQTMTKIALAAWTGFVPLVLYLLTTLLIYAVFGLLLFGGVSLSSGNEFLDTHYNFNTIQNAVIVLLIIGTGNGWTEIISDLHNKNEMWLAVVSYIYFFLFYLMIMIVFRLFALMNIQKIRLNDYKTSYLAQDQINQFRTIWRDLFQSKTYISIAEMYKFLAMLPRPLGIAREGSNTVHFFDLDRHLRGVLCCIPKSENPDMRYTNPMSENAFVYDLLPQKLIQDFPDKQFSFNELLVAVHKAAIVHLHLPDELSVIVHRSDAKKRLNVLKYFISVFINNEMAPAAGNDPMPVRNLLTLQRLDKDMYLLFLAEIFADVCDALRNRINSSGPSGLDALVCSKLKAALDYHLHISNIQLNAARILSANSPDNNSPEFKNMILNSTHHSEIKAIHRGIRKLFDLNVQQKWDLNSVEQMAQITEKGKTVCCLHIDEYCTIYTAYAEGMIKIWRKEASESVLVTKETDFKKYQVINTDPGLRCIAVSSDGKRLVAAVEAVLILFTIDSRAGVRNPQFKESLRMNSGFGSNINAVLFTHRYIATASSDGVVKLWAGTSNKPGDLLTANVGSQIFSMISVDLMKYVHNAEAYRDRITVHHAIFVGQSNGGISMLPVPLSKNFGSEGFAWPAVSVSADVLGYKKGVSVVAIAFKFLYIGYVDGTVRIYAITLPNLQLLFLDGALSAVVLVFMDSHTIHAAPVVSIREAGANMFTASRDTSIMKWNAPTNLAADCPSEFNQTHETAMIVHGDGIISMASNDYCLVSGDEGGKIVISAPLSTCDTIVSDTKKSALEPKVDFSYISYDFGAVYVPSQGVVSFSEKILVLRNRFSRPVSIRKIPKIDPNFDVELLKDESLSLGAVIRTETLPGDRTPSDIVILAPGRQMKYRISFKPTELRRYMLVSEFIIDEGDQTMVVKNFGHGEKPLVSLGSTETIVDFGDAHVGIKKNKCITVLNNGSRPLLIQPCDSLTPSMGHNGEPTLATMIDRNIHVFPHSALLQPGVPFHFDIFYEPLTAEEPSFNVPLNFSYNGSVLKLGTIKSENSLPVTEDITKNEADKVKGETAKTKKWLEANTVGRHFHRTDEEKLTYEAILQSLHSKHSIELIEKHFSEYTRTSIFERGSRQLLFTEGHVPEKLLLPLLHEAGWRMTHDEHHFCFLHKSGMFLEVIKDYVQSEYSAKEIEMLQNFSIYLFFEKDTSYDVIISNKKHCAGTSTGGKMTEIHITCDDLNKSVFPPEKLTPEQQVRLESDETFIDGLRRSTGHHLVEVRTLIDGEPRSYMIIDILKGYRVIKRYNHTTAAAETFWYERIFIKGILECKTYFNNKFDGLKMPASYIPEIKEVKGKPSEIMKGDFELTGLIDETFGTHQYFGVVDETEHRGRPHMFGAVTVSVSYPERYNKFLIVDGVQVHSGNLGHSKMKKYEWSKSFDFSSGDSIVELKFGRPKIKFKDCSVYAKHDEEYGTRANLALARDAPLPLRAVAIQGIYNAGSTLFGGNDADAYVSHELHVAKGIYSRMKELNKYMKVMDDKREEMIINSCLESLLEIEPFTEEGKYDATLREEGLRKAAVNQRHSPKGRHIHAKDILPRSLHSKSRQILVRSDALGPNIDELHKDQQKRFELMMDYLCFAEPEPEPLDFGNRTEHRYYELLYHQHDRDWCDKLIGDDWIFIKDQYNLRLLALTRPLAKGGDLPDEARSRKSLVSNISVIDLKDDLPGEIKFDSQGCFICKSSSLKNDLLKPSKGAFVVMESVNTIRCTNGSVKRTTDKSPSDFLRAYCFKKSELHWQRHPKCIKQIYRARIRNETIVKVYDSVVIKLERQKLKELHEQERKQIEAEKTKSGGTVKPDGFVSKRMLADAITAEKDRKPPVGERDVFDYYIEVTKPMVVSSYARSAADMDSSDKINLYKFHTYLLTHVLEGVFDEILSPETVNEILSPIERYRDTGLPFTVFKNWIAHARDPLTSDNLDSKNLFAWLLQEKTDNKAGFRFDRERPYYDLKSGTGIKLTTNIRRYFGESSKRKTKAAYGTQDADDAEAIDPLSPLPSVASGGGQSVSASKGKSYMYLTMGQDDPSDPDASAEEDEDDFADIGNKIEENVGGQSMSDTFANFWGPASSSTAPASTAADSTPQAAAVEPTQNIWGGILGIFGVNATVSSVPAHTAVPTAEVPEGAGGSCSQQSELDSHKLAEIEYEGEKYVVFDKQNGPIFSMDSKGVVDKQVGVMQNGVATFDIVV